MDGRLALVLVDPRGLVALAEGSTLSVLGLSDQSVGSAASLALARWPELVRALEGAKRGERTTLTISASGRSFDASVEPRRGGGALVVATDVTARKQREEARRALDSELRMIFRQAPGAVWSTDRNLAITRAFGRVAAELQLEASKVLGQSVYGVLGTRDPGDAVVAGHAAALAGRRVSYRYAFRGRQFEILTEPLRDASQRITGTVSAAIDVSRFVDTEQRLARSQALLADAQRVAHVGSFEWDVTTDAVTWSDEMYRIHGLREGELEATFGGMMSRVAPEDVAATRHAWFAAFRSRSPFLHDHRIIRPDGSERMLHTRGDVVLDSEGKATRMLGSCWDVTEKYEAERALDRAASLLRATLEATADGLLVVDRSGQKITAFNQRFIELWGVPEDLVADGDDAALLAYVLDQVTSPGDFLKRIQELYARPEESSFDIVRFKDGRVFERLSRAQRVGDVISGRVWSFRDVTEREHQLRRALFLADAARLLSSLGTEPALSSIAHLAVPFLGDVCAIDLLFEGAPRRVSATSLDDARSPTFALSPTVLAGRSAVYAAGASYFVGVPIMLDGAVIGGITLAATGGRRLGDLERELAEELAQRLALAFEKERLLENARQALRARDELLAIAAHEIRGPITSLHAAVQLLLRKQLPPAIARRALELIEREDRRLGRFIDELLDLGLTHADTTFELEPVSLARVVRDVVSQQQDDIAHSGSVLKTELSEAAIGNWNRARLESVVSILLSNALKFGVGKPIEITVRIKGDRAVLRVLDHGIGIAEEARKRIFSPYERAVSVRHYGGLGLGLHIASSVVKALGGTITVESEVDVGSIFTVELPLGTTP